ncbi:hypothetical protein SETIT_1G349100v2 [Setaria italica]|nr:hypothetical protein SETIT_1G349100v2 [Setaria italica]
MAGEWALLFYGRVEYVPEHRLWFGFSSQVWDELTPPLPKRWIPVESYLQSLGTGKFCIVKTFDTVEEGWCREKNGNMFKNVERFAVFTGVKVERGSRGAFRMIKHKSRRYSFGQRIVQTFLF